MKLDLNFSAMSRLRDWWKQVYNNFETIETECTTTREIAENACTKEQAQAYVAEFAQSSEEYMEAITAFKEIYENSGDSIEALEEIFGERVKQTEYDQHIQDGDIHHTHRNKGILDVITSNKITNWDNKSEVVFGTYTGNYVSSDTTTAKQFINLGFTPVAVEVYRNDGWQTAGDPDGLYRWYYSGGLALRDNPCKVINLDTNNVILEIVENGFNVYSGEKGRSNEHYFWSLNTGEHYFKAYKNDGIIEGETPASSIYEQLLEQISNETTARTNADNTLTQKMTEHEGGFNHPDGSVTAKKLGDDVMQIFNGKADASSLEYETTERQSADNELKTQVESGLADLSTSIDTKAEKTLIHTLSETEINETMGSNHEYRCQEVVSLTLALPEDVPNDYISSIIFTSGATATNLIYPDTVKMVGEGCIDGVFAPSENKRYNIIISYDGVNCVGVVGGYEV